ncbi:MAG: zinc ribbon domain-containing protein [Candidatus Zixiibacteriota bacterium]|nr:MAG: zinc ribbon domain-containing protein [candidate division Zixibacteria bacterium]
MPIYEYQCHACGNDFELLIMGSSNGSACPACGSKDMKRKFSVFGMKSSSGFSSSSGSSCGGCQSNSCVGCKN